MIENELNRFMSKVHKDGECWIFTSLDVHGYGQLRIQYNTRKAHRLAFEHWIGPIPANHDVHHVCGNPACVNPDHLEAVESAKHVRFSTGPHRRSKTHCKRGHEYTPENTGLHKRPSGRVDRYCLTCKRNRERRVVQH